MPRHTSRTEFGGTPTDRKRPDNSTQHPGMPQSMTPLTSASDKARALKLSGDESGDVTLTPPSPHIWNGQNPDTVEELQKAIEQTQLQHDEIEG